jgi:HEAT repeat protein
VHAFVWPDVAERVEHDLVAADPAVRRAAARDLVALGSARGTSLALRALGDSDLDVRLAAADAAIRLRSAGATDLVAGWLNSADARLRRKACEVARALPSPRVVPPLARTLGDPDADVRLTAADALGHQASADAVPPLLGRLDDAAPAVRIQIVASLARLGDLRAVVPLVGKVQDSSPEVREAVARALGDLGDARASSALILALRDANADVRRDALAALGRMHASEAVDAIAPFVQERSPSLRMAALTALGHIASAEAVRVLVAALGTADDSGATLDRTPPRDALVAAGSAAIPSLHGVLEGSPSPAAGTSAAWVLGALHARSEASTIVLAMRRGALPTQAALHALGGAGSPAEVPVVLEFVADPSPVVRNEALAAAAALLDPNHPDGRAVEPLAAVLRDARPLPTERARIARLLGRTGAPRAAPLLVEVLRAREPALRLAAIDALGTLGSASPVAPASQAGNETAIDGALMEALASPDATIRLHAAIALGEAGGAGARDALVAQLDGGDEVDRAAVLTALGGTLARVPSEAAIAKLTQALQLAAGPERDALVEALGRAPLPSAMHELEAVARSDEPADRRAVATLLPAHATDPLQPGAQAVARAMLGDPDAAVRAQAAWALGALGDATDIARLEGVARGDVASGTVAAAPAFTGLDAQCDAAAAIGRIALRVHAAEAAAHALCPLVGRAPSLPACLRANALAGLALAGARCADGAAERSELNEDPSEDARAAAALLLSQAASPDDKRALDRCARSDPSSLVAGRCRAHPSPAGSRTHATLVYVVADGAAAPRPASAYALLLADGTLHVGTTDRRGAVFDPTAPEGELTLRKPSALSR